MYRLLQARCSNITPLRYKLASGKVMACKLQYPELAKKHFSFMCKVLVGKP